MENQVSVETAAMSLSDKVMNVFASPSELFDSVAKSEKQASNYVIPLLLSIIVGVVFTFVVFSQPAIQNQMQEQQMKGFKKQITERKITQEQMEKAMEYSKPGSPIFLIFGAGGVIVVNILMLYLFALGFLLIGKFGFKSTASYGKHVEVVGLGMYVMVVSSLITMAMVVAMGSLHASPSLALFVSNFDPMNTMHKVLSAVNILTFWYLAVVAIGMSKLWNVSTAKAIAGVGGAWVVWTAITTQLSFGM